MTSKTHKERILPPYDIKNDFYENTIYCNGMAYGTKNNVYENTGYCHGMGQRITSMEHTGYCHDMEQRMTSKNIQGTVTTWNKE